MKRTAAGVMMCPRCGQPAHGGLLDEPAGHQVRDMQSREWRPAQACIKCVDEIRVGKSGRAKKAKAANDTTAPARKGRRMEQIEMFGETPTTTKGSP